MCLLFSSLCFISARFLKWRLTSRGFARAGLFGLLVVNITKFSIKTKRDEETFTPALAKPLLYAVLFVFNVLIFAVVRWEIYSFFGGREKREGKSSFADLGFGAGLAVCKCAFSFALALVASFRFLFWRIYFHIVKIEVYIVPI